MTAPYRARSHCHLHVIVDVFGVFQLCLRGPQSRAQVRMLCRVEAVAGAVLLELYSGVSRPVACDCLRVVSLSLMALTNALCACAGHYHCVAIAVDRVNLSVLVCVYLYVPHDAMPCPVVLGAMLCDAPRDGLRCCMMPYNATWCFAMPHDVPQYSAWGAAIRCDARISLPCPACSAPCHAPCDAPCM